MLTYANHSRIWVSLRKGHAQAYTMADFITMAANRAKEREIPPVQTYAYPPPPSAFFGGPLR